jgi:type IV secretory pathway VirB10-like protein
MSSIDDMDARHGRMLAELAEAGMGVARSLYAATQPAPVSNADFALLAEAFHTVSRSIRQTIALEFKLKHEPRQPAAPKPEPKPEPAPPPPTPEVRPEQVYWNEYERADWTERLDEALDAGDAEAVNAAIEASVARIQRGLTRAERVLATTGHRTTPAVDARTRSALFSTSSPLSPGPRVPRNRDDAGGDGKRPRSPPWRGSG